MDPEFTHDPNRAYARLREQAPLVRIGTPGAPPVWLVTRCADVRSMLSDPEIVVDHANVPGNEGTSLMDQLLGALDLPDDFRAEFRTYARNMMFVDGDEHARLRKLILPAFAVKRIKALRPAIEEMSARLLDALAAKGGGDLIEEYSSPLTGTVICELIGFDRADHPRVRKLMRSYADGDIHFSGREMVECTKELIARRRAEPADDLISTLVRTRDETGDRLSEDEMVAMVLLLIMNGHHSTSFFIPASVVALFRNPDQLALLRAEPELMPDAIEELLRVANPVPVTSPRYATRDMELSGCPVRKGETLTGSFFAANFDPRAFPDPERLDLRRERRRGEGHVSFGAGPHYCTGAALAKLETDVALRHLLLDRDTLEIAVPLDELEYTDATLGVHMLAGLPVWL
ncbi:cytochrome P450 [Streptomyces capoamus]|uniref:Cytochrome P450 n=2 Tax=Streptomyces capoamus TaxID=68183 RepID=A0A919F498_9ACTN|nr:cytochrome P450 [Streptomyces libani subsp. rufus]GHG75710.1 cytochrome P450 [Streptomyces capoamus]